MQTTHTSASPDHLSSPTLKQDRGDRSSLTRLTSIHAAHNDISGFQTLFAYKQLNSCCLLSPDKPTCDLFVSPEALELIDSRAPLSRRFPSPYMHWRSCLSVSVM
ncbi:hypothetical protein CC2G_005349 [Coprinopsis cinerea AmutBmut pab1-1]|nr:hypothetical protein CC2G_005349 [Coprinopsis cinerea AmutBmut pab1-1]